MSQKARKIKIAFDLDGVIIDKPPLIPRKLIEWLFRGSWESGLCYRFPTSKLEQRIRKLSHFYLLRPPIKKNVSFIKKIASYTNYELYVLSGRYSFLKGETEVWLQKRGLKRLFKQVIINLKNEQPHVFKERIIRKLKPDFLVDDDPPLTKYLNKKVKNISIFCFPDEVKELKEELFKK
jgi:FMN phosphatase YigB (HAD superfamily)